MMVSTWEMLFVLSPVIVLFGVLLNCDYIVAWWDRRHPELRPTKRGDDQ